MKTAERINQMCKRLDTFCSTSYHPEAIRDAINERFVEYQREGFADDVAFAKAINTIPACQYITKI